ncbi:MAG TPA: ElyC/SanA/YdcF family protein [Pyrinomonadaceae bacterium]|nr:ElyC/SanA/YdcF family protein [Pyrinomonadaceae bacterium]
MLLIVGFVLLWSTRRQKAGKLFVTIGGLLLIFLGYGISTNWLLKPLERQYQPILRVESLTAQNPEPIKWIVVLGGGGSFSSQLPSPSQLSNASLTRLIEGIRLHRQLPGSKLILSEGNIFESGPVGEIMGQVAQDLGVDKADLVMETQSQDTEAQATLMLPLVGSERFILVTSASHMPRSMALFRKQGLNPIAAPTDFESVSAESWRPSALYPSAGGLRKAELAIHEYVGLAWAKLRGKI